MRAPQDSKRWQAQGKHRRGGRLASLALGVLLWAIAGAGTVLAQCNYCVNATFPFHCGEVCMHNSLNRSQPPAPAPSFGALAVGVQDSRTFVFSTGFATQGQAEAEAVKKCNARVAHSGQGCTERRTICLLTQ